MYHLNFERLINSIAFVSFFVLGCTGVESTSTTLQDATVQTTVTSQELDMETQIDFAIDQLNSDEEFELCAAHMQGLLSTPYQQFCSDYSETERDDPASEYARDFVVAACLYLACDTKLVEGHNAVMIGKSCKDLEDLQLALTQAITQATTDEDCPYPTYQTRVLLWEDFMGGESCDQLQCSISLDGAVVETSTP
jgi:hypothetical protein